MPKACSKECSNKLRGQTTKSSMLEKYGVENASQYPEFQKKMKASLAAQKDEIKMKRDKTMMERYGCLYPMQNEELKAKIQKTNEERYGSKNPVYNEGIRMKISERLKSPEVHEKYLQTSLKNWGVSRPSMTQEVQDKMKATNIEKYGVPCGFQLESYLGNKDGWISAINRHVADEIEKHGLSVEFEFYLKGRLYDLHIVDTNILIEINPTYTHNAIGNHWGVVRDEKYHLSKTELAESEGFQCIHIFEWDDLDKVISLFLHKNKLYARNCQIKEISYQQACDFEQLNHIQGRAKNQKICLGLFSNDELVELMTFGPPRYSKNYQWELLRLCSKYNDSVIGGASKLFKYFVDTYHPESIISYCDRAKFTGSVYKDLGMTLDHISLPSKIWSRDKDKITDNLLRARGYDQLFSTQYGKGTSNEDLMIEAGWLPVYDCGQKVFVYN